MVYRSGMTKAVAMWAGATSNPRLRSRTTKPEVQVSGYNVHSAVGVPGQRELGSRGGRLSGQLSSVLGALKIFEHEKK